MILGGTVTSPPVSGTTVQDPADTSPTLGLSVIGNGRYWQASTCPGYVVSALGTLAAGTTILDWTQAGLFTFTAYGGAFTLSFTNAAGVFTPVQGQALEIFITGAGSAAATWPTTITWCGSVAAGGGSTSAPVLSTNTTSITLVCLSGGSAPTFLGTYITS